MPLLRIEHRHDLIPHLPLPPSLAGVLGRGVIDPLIEAMDWLSPVLRGARVGPTEYVHAGELLVRRRRVHPLPRAAGRLSAPFRPDPAPGARRPTCSGVARRRTPPAYRDAACPRWATPVPARLMDGVRLSATVAQIVRQVRQRRLDFLLDHHIDGALAFVDRIERQRH